MRANNYWAEKRRELWNTLRYNLEKEIHNFSGQVGLIIVDLDKGWEISFNREKKFVSASLVKIPIMATCFLALQEKRIDFNKEIKLKNSYKMPGSGTLKYEPEGKIFKIEEIIRLMVEESDNTATRIITDILGLDYINRSFEKLGLMDTNLSRRVADYRMRKKGYENYTTPKDMAYILEMIYRGELINREVSNKAMELLKNQKIKDRIPRYLPSNVIVAHKTGLERHVCHDVGIVFTPYGDFLICVLVSHRNKNSKLAKRFIAKIALYTYQYFEEIGKFSLSKTNPEG